MVVMVVVVVSCDRPLLLRPKPAALLLLCEVAMVPLLIAVLVEQRLEGNTESAEILEVLVTAAVLVAAFPTDDDGAAMLSLLRIHSLTSSPSGGCSFATLLLLRLGREGV